MNFYKHHIGDYAAATSHLSILEDGAYSRLLRIYYRDESPLPADTRAVQRLAGARTKDEREAVVVVLEEFFDLQDDGWHSKRADEEIARANVQAETNRRIAEEREARRRATKQSRIEHESCNESFASREPSQTPDSRQEHTEANASAAGAAPEPEPDPIWGTGLAYLLRCRIAEKQARSLLGKLRQACGDVETGALLAQAEAESILDPAPWLMAAASKRRARAGPNGVPKSQTRSAAEILLRGTSDANLAERRNPQGLEQDPLLALGRHAAG